MTRVNQYFPAIVIFLMGVFVSFYLHEYRVKSENIVVEDRFVSASSERIDSISNRLASKLTILKSVVAFIQNSNKVTHSEFHSFVKIVSSEGQGLQALEWIPVVHESKRLAFVNERKKDGFPNYQIFEKNEQGKKSIAKGRENYFPVYYVEPYKGNEGAHGFDLGSSATRLKALNEARDTGKQITSKLIHLIQLKENNEGVLIFSPVYSSDTRNDSISKRRKKLKGFALAVLRLSDTISGVFKASNKKNQDKHSNIDVYLYDITNITEAELLYLHNSRSRKNSKAPRYSYNDVKDGLSYEYKVEVGGRTWAFVTKPIPEYFSNSSVSHNILPLVLSLIVTCFITFYFVSVRRQTSYIESIVKQRTFDLNYAVEAANQKERRIRAIVDNSGEGIITINEKGIVVTINKAFESLLGYTEKETKGKNISKILSLSENSPKDYISELDFDKLQKESQSYDVVGCHKSGRNILLEVTLSSVTISSKKMLIGIVHDVSARKEAEKLKEGFISTVSHELRTPMTSIKGSLSLLLSGSMGSIPTPATNMIEVAYNNSERLIRLINDILDVDKMASGKMQYDIKLQDLVILLKQSIESNQGYAQEHDVTFNLESTLKSANVNIDFDRIIQVMTNLLSNAAKFSNQNDTVTISLKDDGEQYCVSVKDTGPGIPDEFRSKIFERFSQADISDNKNTYGTGLGLAICKTIIIEHKGKIDYETEVGVGTVFYYCLPKA